MSYNKPPANTHTETELNERIKRKQQGEILSDQTVRGIFTLQDKLTKNPFAAFIPQEHKQALLAREGIPTPKEPTPEPITKRWSLDDQLLIDWVLKYINERTTTRHTYTAFEDEIALGPDSPRARSGELQKGLRLLKRLVESSTNCRQLVDSSIRDNLSRP